MSAHLQVLGPEKHTRGVSTSLPKSAGQWNDTRGDDLN